MIVKRAIKNNQVVAGGGATEMEISKFLREKSKTIEGKQQAIMSAFAKSLEIIPRQLCDNAGIDATDILNKLRMLHARGEMWSGIDIESEGVANNMEKFVWEPSLVKINALSGATEAACLVLRYVSVLSTPPFNSLILTFVSSPQQCRRDCPKCTIREERCRSCDASRRHGWSSARTRTRSG